MHRLGPIALAFCFFLSGVGSLALEVVWTRELRLVFGSTTLAASTILVAYMLGLGLGGLVGGRVAGRLERGVRAYGWIEVAIGGYALVVPWLLAQLPALNRSLLAGMDFWPAVFCRFAVALALLLLPTVLMGATLPILVAALAQRDAHVGASTGLLYGLNTLGAVAGVFLATFVLFPTLGLVWTNRFGALLDVAVGVLALTIVERSFAASRARDTSAAPTPPESALAPAAAAVVPAPVGLLLIVYGAVGFTALLYEVAWSRALAVVFGSSIYAFSSMLGAFLMGIALGSLLFRRSIDASRAPRALLAWGIAALAVLALGTTMVLPHLPALFLWVVERFGIDSGRIALARVLMCIVAMLPPTLILGGLFPLVARLLADEMDDVGAAIGRVYFANTLGSAAGAFCAGFLLLPSFGLRDTLALGAGIDLLAVALLLLVAPRTSRTRIYALAPLAAVALLLALPIPFDRQALTRGVFKAPTAELSFGIELAPVDKRPPTDLLFYRDGINATVSVHRDGGILVLRVNGKADASSFGDMSTQVLLGQLPLLYGPPAKKVLVIGYASGVTTGSVATHPEVERIDAVELEPAIVEASHYFDRQSGKPLDDPRVKLIVDDGRSYLASTRERYDVIISEPSNPWMSGVANLFTREFFAIVHGALAPGGRLLQWVQMYSLDPPSLASIVAALRTEFQFVYAFADTSGTADILLLAQDRPLAASDLPRWEKLPHTVQADLERIGNFSTTDLWSLMRATPADIDALARKAPVVNTDDNLFIELGTPWMLYNETAIPNWRALVSGKEAILPLLVAFGEPLDMERIGDLALSHARKKSDAAGELLVAAGKRGRAGSSITAATIMARGMTDGSLTLEDQLETLDEAVALAPTSFEARLLRGEVRIEAHDFAGALTDGDEALALRPEDPRVFSLRMRALASLGRYAEAQVDADALLTTSYGQSDGVVLRAAPEVALRNGQIARGIEQLEWLLREYDPSWSYGWMLLSWAYAQQGDMTNAERAQQNEQATTRNRALLYHRLARWALWEGKQNDAVGLLDQALLVDPDYQDARRERERIAPPES